MHVVDGAKVVRYKLGPLRDVDAAALFLRRIHRPLYPRDFRRPQGPNALSGEVEEKEEEKLMVKPDEMASHPLIRLLHGNPQNIISWASSVTDRLPTIWTLVFWVQRLPAPLQAARLARGLGEKILPRR